MKKVLLFSAALFVIALGMGVSASAETKKIGNFKYEYDSAPNGNDVWITQITPVTAVIYPHSRFRPKSMETK